MLRKVGVENCFAALGTCLTLRKTWYHNENYRKKNIKKRRAYIEKLQNDWNNCKTKKMKNQHFMKKTEKKWNFNFIVFLCFDFFISKKRIVSNKNKFLVPKTSKNAKNSEKHKKIQKRRKPIRKTQRIQNKTQKII